MARTNRPDEAYHIPTLNKWFAISGIALLATSVWMVIDDHQRSWKETQRDFRELERTRLVLMREAAERGLEEEAAQKNLEALQSKFDNADQALVAKSAEYDAQRKKVDELEWDVYYVAKQNYNFAKAEVGTLRYDTEHIIKYHPGEPVAVEAQKKYDCEVLRVEGPDADARSSDCGFGDEFESLRTLFLNSEDDLLAAQAKLAELEKERKEAEAALDKAREAITAVDKKLEPIAANLFNDNIRDAPMLDFLAPSITINQAVIPTIRDDYNFATVQKEDRCHTCHLGIGNKEYVVNADTRRFADEFTRAGVENELMAQLVDFVNTSVPQADREYVLEDLDGFKKKPEMSLEAWAKESLDDDALTEKLMASTADLREEMRVRTATYSAHPDLDLYVTSTSPHPLLTVGCSVCHEGRGHAVEFNRVYHTPQNEEQAAFWADEYGWHEPHYWDHPQLPSGRVTASCAKCHDPEPTVRGADALNAGRAAVERYGCYGCHRIQGMTGVYREAGPSLVKVASKVDADFLQAWIWNPLHFRPASKMPRFFEQDNNDEGEFLERTKQEVRGIVAYLRANTDAYEPGSMPGGGVAERGKRLFEEVGCLGCHAMESAGLTVNNHGPDLSGIGSKLSAEWLYSWIKNPRRYFPETHMPSLRLTNQEAADITAYLMSVKKEGWTTPEQPPRNAKLQETLLQESLSTSMRRSELNAMLGGMSPDEREVLVGRKSIEKYGCTGCHAIKGFEAAQPIGTELTTWGSKFVTQLDFGNFKPDDVGNNHIAWATQKLKNPRHWDFGKDTTKTFAELLKMPKFNLTEDEISSLVTFLKSRTKRILSEQNFPKPTAQYEAVQAGRVVARQYNCQGCHYFDGEGGNFAQYWGRDVAGKGVFKAATAKAGFDYLEDIPGPVRGVVPPLLLDQGNKTETEWLFGFLHNPTTLRPQLVMRMPTFQFTDDEVNALLRYFAGLEGRLLGDETSYEPDPQQAVLGQELFNRGKCTQCHMFTDRDVPRGSIPANVVAPNLKLAASRLQHTWTPRWLEDPQGIMPGANMPNYFFMDTGTTTLDVDNKTLGGDLHKGMNAIRDYLEVSGRTYRGPESASR